MIINNVDDRRRSCSPGQSKLIAALSVFLELIGTVCLLALQKLLYDTLA